jgi:hypothetical protein
MKPLKKYTYIRNSRYKVIEELQYAQKDTNCRTLAEVMAIPGLFSKVFENYYSRNLKI